MYGSGSEPSPALSIISHPHVTIHTRCRISNCMMVVGKHSLVGLLCHSAFWQVTALKTELLLQTQGNEFAFLINHSKEEPASTVQLEILLALLFQ